MLSIRAVSASTSTSAVRFSSPIPDKLSVKLIAPPVAIIAFEGTQSKRCAAPPSISRSIKVTDMPRRAAADAAE